MLVYYLYTCYYELKMYHFTNIAAYIGNHSSELLGQQDRMTQRRFKDIKYSIHTYIKQIYTSVLMYTA